MSYINEKSIVSLLVSIESSRGNRNSLKINYDGTLSPLVIDRSGRGLWWLNTFLSWRQGGLFILFSEFIHKFWTTFNKWKYNNFNDLQEGLRVTSNSYSEFSKRVWRKNVTTIKILLCSKTPLYILSEVIDTKPLSFANK